MQLSPAPEATIALPAGASGFSGFERLLEAC